MFDFKLLPFRSSECKNCKKKFDLLADTRVIFSTDGSRYCKCTQCDRFNKYDMNRGIITLVPRAKETTISGFSLRKEK